MINNTERMSIHHTWLNVAEMIAKDRSTCKSGRFVGALIVSKNGRILTTGYNGVPSKMLHPLTCARRDAGFKSGEGLCMCKCQHAESNAIVNAARNGVKLEGSILYCTTSPCVDCFGKILNCGIAEVHYRDLYGDLSEVEEMAELGNIKLFRQDY